MTERLSVDTQTIDTIVRKHCITNISYLISTLLATYRYGQDQYMDELFHVKPLAEDYIKTAQAAGCVFIPDAERRRYAVVRNGTLVLPTEIGINDAARRTCQELKLVLPQRFPSQYWIVSTLLGDALAYVGGTIVTAGAPPSNGLIWIKEAPGDPRDDPLIARVASLTGQTRLTSESPPPIELPRILAPKQQANNAPALPAR